MRSFLKRHRIAALVTLIVVVVLAAAAGGAFYYIQHQGKDVTVAGDQVGCVYGSANSGHKFKRSIQPGQTVNIGKTNELVLLPSGDQLYNVTTSGNRTTAAPSRVLAFTKGQTAVWVEGVLKFRFNLTGDKACRWYSKYGLQSASYGDLGFAVRSGIERRNRAGTASSPRRTAPRCSRSSTTARVHGRGSSSRTAPTRRCRPRRPPNRSASGPESTSGRCARSTCAGAEPRRPLLLRRPARAHGRG